MVDGWNLALMATGGLVALLGCYDVLLGRLGRAPEAVEVQGNDRRVARGKGDGRLKVKFLLVYAFVMTADWLQGPYIFSLYHDEYKYSLEVVAALFVLGFLSAGIFAPFIGDWADRFGRRRLCLVFTATYTLSCATKMFRPLPYLILGRLLGGLSTSILFSVFESWLVSEAVGRKMEGLESFLGRLTLVNGGAACLAGLLSERVVGVYETFKAPFVASAGILVVAGLFIATTWRENYGDKSEVNGMPRHHLVEAVKILWNDSSLLYLMAVTTAFEGSMYIFVFLWVPTIQATMGPNNAPLPLGLIFSSFMIALSGGSILYNILLFHFGDVYATSVCTPSPAPVVATAPSPVDSASDEGERAPLLPAHDHTRAPLLPLTQTVSIRLNARLASMVLIAGGAALFSSNFATTANSKFRYFLAFEAAVGMYYPTAASLRSALVDEEHRATINALFRVPVNLLVTIALLSGLETRPNDTFVLCFCMLLVASAPALGIGVNARRRLRA